MTVKAPKSKCTSIREIPGIMPILSMAIANFLNLATIIAGNLEVVGHEFTHGVTNKTAELIYNNEPGALNESFSDIFGHFIGGENDWLIGNGLPDPRSMSNPGIDHYSKYSDKGLIDHGGVHTNSGIHNKAAYLITAGDTFMGYDTRPGIGWPKAQTLFYKMLLKLPKWAQLIDARNAAVLTINEMKNYPPYGITTQDICIVLRAYAAVGLGNGDSDCDGIEDSYGPDYDHDTIPDLVDNCPEHKNVGQQDTDEDGIGDRCDFDNDYDAFLDHYWGEPCIGGNEYHCNDNCWLTYQTDQADWDGNGVGDACDDYDGDGKVDEKDNCREIGNTDQFNHDTDPMGDACDPDDDNDGVMDFPDNCPIKSNPGQEDHDVFVSGNWAGDGIGDACDLCPHMLTQINDDPDNDGLANPCDPDDDGDQIPEDGNNSGVEGDFPCRAGAMDDCDDNCPNVSNYDQFDYNKNGIGFACEPGDIPNLGDHETRSFPWVPGRAIVIPLPGGEHPDWGQDYLGLGYREKVTLETNTDVFARIVDSQGNMLTRSSRHDTNLSNQTLEYELAPFAVEQGISMMFGSSSPAQPAMEIAPNAIRYYLQLYPTENTPINEPLTLTLQISAGVPFNIYLPVMRK